MAAASMAWATAATWEGARFEMPSLHEPFAFTRGDTFTIEAWLHYADGKPFNLGPGAAIIWQLEDGKGDVILSLSLSAGGIAVLDLDVLDASPPGVPHHCLVTITAAQSAAITEGRYRDQLRATDPAGVVSTQSVGSIDVRKSFFAG